jgi:hypothetical protein
MARRNWDWGSSLENMMYNEQKREVHLKDEDIGNEHFGTHELRVCAPMAPC